MSAYYNEIDPYAAQWLRNLIAAGHIAPGDVDERDIKLVRPVDLIGYDQCHFFAGIGAWSHALRLAGWPDDRPVWTGSCPCQPFSAAGKGEGTADARHLWPHWFRLIREHRPVTIFGEQVAAAIRHSWLDLVCAGLEGLDYAVGAAVLGAHSVGAPHIRQRLYFVADAQRRAAERRGHDVHGAPRDSEGEARQRERLRAELGAGVTVGGMAHSDGRNASAERLQRGGEHGLKQEDGGAGGMADLHSPRCGEGRTSEAGDGRGPARVEPSGFRAADELGDSTASGRQGRDWPGIEEQGPGQRRAASFWSDCDWLPCIDGKARPVEPGTFPLAHGATARVGRLRAYGNAICAPAAAEFIRSAL